jgi:hypothetical protein
MRKSILINPVDPNTKYVALDINNRLSIIAEGLTVKSVIEKANDTGKEYSLLYIPEPGQKCIF